MTCAKCSAALVTPDQVERGLCAMCLTGASLSALVGLAASHQPTFKPPVYFGSDLEWKASEPSLAAKDENV